MARHAEGRLVAPSRSPRPRRPSPSSNRGSALRARASRSHARPSSSSASSSVKPSARSLPPASASAVALAALRLPANCKNTAIWAHLALLDGCLQAVGLTVPAPADAGDVPLLRRRADRARAPAPRRVLRRLRALARSRRQGGRVPRAAARPRRHAPRASPVLRLRRASREVLTRVAGAGDSGLYYRKPIGVLGAARPGRVPVPGSARALRLSAPATLRRARRAAPARGLRRDHAGASI